MSNPVTDRGPKLLKLAGLAILLACPPDSAAAERPIEQFLTGMEFVAEGRLLDAWHGRTSLPRGCDGVVQFPHPRSDFRVVLTRVLSGASDESVVTISTLGEYGDPRKRRPRWSGRVLLWGIRPCVNSWRLHGALIGIDHDGEFSPICGSYEGFRLGEGAESTALDFDRHLSVEAPF